MEVNGPLSSDLIRNREARARIWTWAFIFKVKIDEIFHMVPFTLGSLGLKGLKKISLFTRLISLHSALTEVVSFTTSP